MSTYNSRGWAPLIIAAALLIAGCGVNLYPVSEDVKLGKQISAEIAKDPKHYPVLTGAEDARNYVQGVVNRVVTAPQIKYRGTFPYTVTLINDDKTINAFCVPGGYIYVYTGLLKFIDDEATLAGILGHEIAHAECRHTTQRMTKTLGTQAVLAIILGQNPTGAAGLAAQYAGVGAQLGLLKNSRDDEAEADKYSVLYLSSGHEYYPGAILSFFKKMTSTRNSGGPLAETVQRLLSDHPLDQDRVDAVNKQLADLHTPLPTPKNIYFDRYQGFKHRLP
jgi:predicted Zn-dependent protease